SGSVVENTTIKIESAPFVTISDILESVGTTLDVTIQNLFGTYITQFNQPFTLTFDLTSADLSRVDPQTLVIYSSNDGATWNPEETILDLPNQTASATLNHLTQFALVGERIDTQAPVTSAD